MNKSSEGKGEVIINRAIAAHGGERYKQAHYSFVFRDKEYQFKNDGDAFTYTHSVEKDGNTTVDVLSNESFQRSVNGKKIVLDEKNENRYRNALNSVIYFSTLPYKLSDGAVNKKYLNETIINEIKYHLVEVTFNEEGGGDDHDDVFYYWINQENDLIDFLAYSYSVNSGGVRFRTAENKRTVGGIVFQDYINYKAEKGTDLSILPELWKSGQLKKLSEIRTEKIQQL